MEVTWPTEGSNSEAFAQHSWGEHGVDSLLGRTPLASWGPVKTEAPLAQALLSLLSCGFHHDSRVRRETMYASWLFLQETCWNKTSKAGQPLTKVEFLSLPASVVSCGAVLAKRKTNTGSNAYSAGPKGGMYVNKMSTQWFNVAMPCSMKFSCCNITYLLLVWGTFDSDQFAKVQREQNSNDLKCLCLMSFCKHLQHACSIGASLIISETAHKASVVPVACGQSQPQWFLASNSFAPPTGETCCHSSLTGTQ